ncbi:hypothetical protein BDU57DRAFT_548542 [Ampelomyces quisqualis]|uniref:UBA domain-containing protein n=1 Tax=Ampelomyces quisqualis TaxID=50730 RepID=A0A6A5QQV7_AMPQU|nr:hypothetical protein BDU57DRAFT_548542 [Ampelomyces quisqualis]
MLQTCHTSGFDAPTITKLISLQHHILMMSTDRPCGIAHPNPLETDSTQPPASKANALVSTGKRRMSLLRNKGSKQSATILHAVPENTTCPSDHLYDEQDMIITTSHCVSNRSQSQSVKHAPSPWNETSLSRVQSHNSNSLSPNKPYHAENGKSTLRNTSLKGAIGFYRHGKIQWRQKERGSSARETKNDASTDKSLRPRMQVVIPSGTRERPLPAIPFFNHSNRNHLTSASIHSENAADISPPSANNKMVMRDSIVSPLNHVQTIPFGHSQQSMSRVMRKTSAQVPHSRNPVSRPSGSSVDSHDDSVSTCSNRSSETSVEADSPPLDGKNKCQNSIQNPTAPVVFAPSPESYVKHFTPPSTSRPRQYTHHGCIERDQAFQPSCSVPRTRDASGALSRQPTITRKSSKRSKSRRSLASTNRVIDKAVSLSTARPVSSPPRDISPTLSQAENDLEEHLTSLYEDDRSTTTVGEDHNLTVLPKDSSFLWDDGETCKSLNESVGQLDQNPSNANINFTSPPALPRKSSKRQSSVNEAHNLSRVPRDQAVSQIDRNCRQSLGLKITIPECKRITEDFELSPIPVPAKHIKRIITPTCAEGVILGILRSLDNLDDLFATAVVNQGFLRVFKRHELDLIKRSLRKMTPPAWEFREIAFPGHDKLQYEDLEMTRPQEEYTPSTYLQSQKRDVQIIRRIKSMIKEKCQSFVRPEISIALISDDAAETSRVDDALWRIWTFCKIFGSGKGREKDIVAQQDWLKGGVMVHQQACTFSIVSTDFMNDTLVSAPDCFGKSNEGGLTAGQLFDMMELWNCLGVLLRGFEGRTAQAREFGIYDNTEIRGGDIDGEEAMLDEWCYFLLTFGLSAVLDLVEPSYQMNATPFRVAAQQGWTNWQPPVFGGSRRNFLKEAASRVYEDKIAHTYATTSTRDIQREMSKQRQQHHITELQHRRNKGPRMPLVRMSQERPMSEWSTVIGSLTRLQPEASTDSNIVSHVPTLRSALAQELSETIAELPGSLTPEAHLTRSSSPPRRTVAQPLLPSPPPSTVPSTRDRNSMAMSMPSIEKHPAYRSQNKTIPAVPNLVHPAFRHHHPVAAPLHLHQPRQYLDQPPVARQQHAIQYGILASAAHENTAEKAIYRIVEMGFTAGQAKEALRKTDMGDGLRPDQAVEFLLRRGY